MTDKKPHPTYSAEFRERGVRLFKEQRAQYGSDNATFVAIAPKLGCSSDSLRSWTRQAERAAGGALSLTSDEQARLKQLERENRADCPKTPSRIPENRRLSLIDVVFPE